MMNIAINIIYEDEALVIVEKPAGVLSIPDRFDANKPNLYHLLLAKYQTIYVVHRLDLDTSGVICFAKTEAAHRNLSLQFEHRTVEKIYLALVNGRPPEAEGVIEAAIAHHPTIQGKMVLHKKGKHAVTHFKCIEYFKQFTLMEASIKTGRTHQVRVHLAGIGHPLVVDPLYSNKSAFFLSQVKVNRYNLGQYEEERPLMSRTTLHALRLTVQHPNSETPITFQSELPKDFRAVIQQITKWGK